MVVNSIIHIVTLVFNSIIHIVTLVINIVTHCNPGRQQRNTFVTLVINSIIHIVTPVYSISTAYHIVTLLFSHLQRQQVVMTRRWAEMYPNVHFSSMHPGRHIVNQVLSLMVTCTIQSSFARMYTIIFHSYFPCRMGGYSRCVSENWLCCGISWLKLGVFAHIATAVTVGQLNL